MRPADPPAGMARIGSSGPARPAWLKAAAARFRCRGRGHGGLLHILFTLHWPCFRYRRPHIITEPEGDRVVGVTWAPPFQGPLDVPEVDIEPYYAAYRTFARLLDESATRLETRLQPGDMACFNNRRVVHGRHLVQLNGGVRYLRGCYINIDEFKSRLYVLAMNAGAERVSVRHVFNQCWS